jgi:ribosomal protein L19E
MTKAKSKSSGEVSNASIATVRRIVADLESKRDSGKLTKDVYKAAVAEAKKATGKDWSEVSEAIENFKP